jgi:hypothetical protein
MEAASSVPDAGQHAPEQTHLNLVETAFRAELPSWVLLLEGAGAFMPLKRAAEEFAFMRGHFLAGNTKPRAKALSFWA